MIPKIIHYCWLSNDPIPEKLQKCMNSWAEKLPDYEFMKWDFSRFQKDSSAWVSEAYDNKKYAFAADYIRLYAIHHYGGIYLDMDIEVVKDFEPLLTNTHMLAYERNIGKGIEAGCFGAEKNHKYIEKCLQYYEGRHFVKEDGSLDQRPLPQIMQEILNSFDEPVTVYEKDFFTAKSFETGIVNPTKRTYAIHHFAGSWLSQEQQAIVEDTQRYSRILGYRLGRNLAEYKNAWKKQRICGAYILTKEKIKRKIEMKQS